jgi:GABA(A) receptor-associated protein
MTTLKLRPGELDKIRQKYPDRIPIFITKSKDTRDRLPDIVRRKFLVPSHFSFGDFIYTIRKWLKLSPEKTVFLFINNIIPSPHSSLSEIYITNKSSDDILYVTYATENAFGSF